MDLNKAITDLESKLNTVGLLISKRNLIDEMKNLGAVSREIGKAWSGPLRNTESWYYKKEFKIPDSSEIFTINNYPYSALVTKVWDKYESKKIVNVILDKSKINDIDQLDKDEEEVQRIFRLLNR